MCRSVGELGCIYQIAVLELEEVVQTFVLMDAIVVGDNAFAIDRGLPSISLHRP
jgi:hypothetical protein